MVMKNHEFKAIIDFAVKNEVEAYEFYKNAALKVKDEQLKGIFEDLAKEEKEHKRFLEEFLASGVEEMKLDEMKDYKISETIDKPRLSVDMSFTEAMELAIKNEEEAMDMYSNLAEACLDKEQKDLFLNLVEMERTHKVKLEEIYLNVAYAEVW